MSDDVVLEVRDLTIERGWDRPLDGVSLEVRRGERLGITGGEDAARSALAKALVGEVADPHLVSGSVVFRAPDGESIDLLAADRSETRRVRWRHVALVPAEATTAFPPTTRVAGAFEETLRSHGEGDDGLERATELLSAVGLDAERVLDATPDRLSEGELERASLALALLLEPGVLVVDGSAEALRWLARGALPTEDLTLVAVVADPRLAAAVADRLAILYGGSVVEIGRTREVLEDPQHPYTRELVRSS